MSIAAFGISLMNTSTSSIANSGTWTTITISCSAVKICCAMEIIHSPTALLIDCLKEPPDHLLVGFLEEWDMKTLCGLY